MAEKRYFTEEERKEFVCGYKNLLYTVSGVLSDSECREIRRLVTHAVETGHYQRNRQGINPALHDLNTALLLCDKIGTERGMILAILLNNLVADDCATLEQIEQKFDNDCTKIIKGLNKARKLSAKQAAVESENFKKLLLTFAEDIRVIIIMIVERLCIMRAINHHPNENYRYEIACEASYLFAPLAHRLGLYNIKSELEDLSLKYTNREVYSQIAHKLSETKRDRDKYIAEFIAPIEEKLHKCGLKFEIKGRTKSIYSIWNKMQTKHIPFEEVYDLYAVRIVFDCPEGTSEKEECWKIYSIITDIYKLHPERTRDWVSRPKANGYKALHLTVMGTDGNWVEVQIRSEKMDEIAERGFAAHWKYKIGDSEEETELDIWLKTIKDVLEHPEPNAIDFLDTIKLNLFSTEIFVFTPKGELITMPKDATALDLAFQLHSDLGFHCIAAKVNHKLVPLSQKLQSGDQVEILTSRSQTPKEEWIGLVTTAKAKSRLAAALRKDRRQIINKGEKMFNDMITDNHINISNELKTKILGNFCLKQIEDFYYKIGSGDIQLDENILKFIKGKEQNIFLKYLKLSFGNNNKKNTDEKTDNPEQAIDRKKTYLLRNVYGKKNYKRATCCNPIPGDDVLGYIDDDEHTVIVHKRECPVAMKLKSSYGSRLVSTQWEVGKELSFPATISIQGIDRMGILNEITKIISNELAINMRSLSIEANEGVFKGSFSILVQDAAAVTALCKKLQKIDGVTKATRKE